MSAAAATACVLDHIHVRGVRANEESLFRELLAQHHYLGALPKIGQTLWYVACVDEEWCALLIFSAASLKCAPRDELIGWRRWRAMRLKLLANNSRFLILPNWHVANLGSRVLALCERALARDWPQVFGHPLLLLETFVDPAKFSGTVYRASNWHCAGSTQGFARTSKGYSEHAQSKLIFIKALYPYSLPQACAQLAAAQLDARFLAALTPATAKAPPMSLTAVQMSSLLDLFADIPDSRTAAGKQHALRTILAMSMGAILCGRSGYKAIAAWVESLSINARERFGCRKRDNYRVPSESTIRRALISVDPDKLDAACASWNDEYAGDDQSLAIDGKTLRAACNEAGEQVHVMSVVGHDSQRTYAQKKSVSD